MNKPIPKNESQRLEQLEYYNILDTEAEAEFDDLTRLASKLLDVPIVLISLIDKDRQWFKSSVGLDAKQTSRDISFCQYAIMDQEIFEVENAIDDNRFKDNPLVTSDPNIRFYAGAPLEDDGVNLGTLCAIDREPKKLNEFERDVLSTLSKTVVRLIKYRREKEEAEKLAEIKDIFLSNMSHEIRTPLNAVIGFTDLLGQSSLNKEQQKYVETISIAGQNLMVLLNDILDISKLENDKLDLEIRPFDIRKMLDHVVQMQISKARNKGLKLLTNVDHDIPNFIMGDETRLYQILINLIGNAIKFTEKGYVELKLIALGSSEDSVDIIFTIKDTGIGIEQDKLNLIFERFAQAEHSTTRKYGGSGLGLSICKMLIELHGGQLEVQSTSGKGSEFSFTLNFTISKDDSKNSLLVKEKDIRKDELKGIKVLIVEDNEFNQILAQTYLSKHKAIVDLAEDGEAAVEKLKENSYDIILMDLQMPKLDGFQATKIIKNELALKTPIVACSAHSLVGERKKCMELGMQDYIAKPYSEDQLISTLKSYVYSDGKLNTEPTIDKSDKKVNVETNFKQVLKNLEEKEGPEFVKAIVLVFNKKIKKDILKMKEAIATDNIDILKGLNHQLIGSMSTLNFSRGFDLAKEAEDEIGKGNSEKGKEKTEELIHYLESAQKEISKISEYVK